MTQEQNQKTNKSTSFDDDPFIKALVPVSQNNTDPRVVVLVAHGLIELMISTLVDYYCLHRMQVWFHPRLNC